MPSTAVKRVNGRSYLYFTCYDYETKRKREIYCGHMDDPGALRRAAKLEKEYLKMQQIHLKSKIGDLEERINRLT